MGNLAAGCFWKRTRFQQSDRVELDTVDLRDSLANPADQVGDRACEIALARKKGREGFQRIRPGDIEAPRV